MSSVIKSKLLRNLDTKEDYIIDPQRTKGQSFRSRRGRSASPEDAADSIIAQAREEAEALLLSARQEAEAIRSAAQQEGRRAALQELEAQRRAMSARLAEIEADVRRQLEEFWTSIEPELLKLAVEISRKVVRQHIDENQGFVLETVKAGLRQLRDRQDLKIRINPEDYEFVRDHKEDIRNSCDGVRSVEIIDDRRVDKGGCLIESGNGHLDARIETQLTEVERALLEAASHGGTEVPSET